MHLWCAKPNLIASRFRKLSRLMNNFPVYGVLGNQAAPRKLFLLLLLAHYQHWAVGIPNNRIRNASHKGPSYPTFTLAPHNHDPNTQLLSKAHYLRVGPSDPRVGMRDLTARLLYLLDLLL